MEYLHDNEKAITYINEAAKAALNSLCLRSRCGSVIVKNDEIIGRGFNSPPLNKKLEYCFKDELPDTFKSDRTCCVHAEQRAIMDALRNYPNEIIGSRLYFIRLDPNGNKIKAGEPYCTICSKMALDVGIKGICVYNTEEYNFLSFK